jgi:hypothetical protein
MNSSNRPAHEIRIGHVRASIWANDGGARQDVWYRVSISRLYRDGDDWKTATSFGRDDLPIVAKAAEMAYAWIWNKNASDGER